MRRWLVMGTAGLWIAFLLWSAGIRVGGLARALPSSWGSAQEIAESRSGDPAYHRFLREVAGAVPRTARVLLLVYDPGRQDLFRTYRAAYDLYPVPHWFVPLSAVPPAALTIRLPVGPDLAGLVQRERVTHAALYDATAEAAGRVYRLAPGRANELRLERVAPESVPTGQRAGEFEPLRPWAWCCGLVVLVALGAAVLEATGLRAVLAGRWAAQAASAWLIGAGITSYWLMLSAMIGWRWSLPVSLVPWGPAVLAVLWRRRRMAPQEPSSPPVAPVAVVGESSLQLRRAGYGLIGLAFVASVLGGLVPLSAWSNWDAWAIWGMKLRACWTHQSLPDAFFHDIQYDFSHPDYPPGISLLQVYFGMWTGGIGETTMRYLHPWYLLAMALLVADMGGVFGLGEERWVLAGACMLVPRLFEQGYNGYSDLPLAAATTAALWWLVLVSRNQAPAWSVGMACGFAALIKNEGLILCAGCAAILGVRMLRGWMRPMALLSAGALMVVLAVPWRLHVWRLDLRATFDVQPRRILAQAPRLAPYLAKAPLLEGFGPALTIEHLRGGGRSDVEFWLTQQRVSWAGFWWFAAVVLACYGWSAGWRDPVWAFPVLQFMQMASSWLVTLGAQYEVLWVLVTSVDRMLLQGTPFMFAWVAACLGREWRVAPPVPDPQSKGGPRKGHRR